MNCPHCAKIIHLEIRCSTVYAGSPEKMIPLRDSGFGFDIAQGDCPACHKLIVLFRSGNASPGDYNSLDELDDITAEQVLYPLSSRSRPIPQEVPMILRNDFDEAERVLPISAKASAAISRRLLQHILHETYGIKRKTLYQEIEDFIATPGIPSYLLESIDAVRNLGNFAAHPLKSESTGSIIDVEPGEADWLLDVLESLFDFAFVQPVRLRKRRDALNLKLNEAGKPQLK